jgi:hypothetical protein
MKKILLFLNPLIVRILLPVVNVIWRSEKHPEKPDRLMISTGDGISRRQSEVQW